jgi:hypothetical protein
MGRKFYNSEFYYRKNINNRKNKIQVFEGGYR